MSAKSQARLQNIARRALYAIEASKRVGKAVLGGKPLNEALGGERANFKAHKDRSRKNIKVASGIDAFVSAHGRIVSWHHGPHTPHDRLHHLAADKKNFDALNGAPAQTGSYPGVEPNCKCFVGPEIPGAPMLR